MSLAEIHPLIIHFPIALFSTAVLFDILGLLLKQIELEKVGKWVMLTALISSLAAIATGLLADTVVGHFDSVYPFWNNHGWLQLISSFLFLLLCIWRLKHRQALSLPEKSLYIIISSAVLGLFFYGSHLGAVLANRI